MAVELPRHESRAGRPGQVDICIARVGTDRWWTRHHRAARLSRLCIVDSTPSYCADRCTEDSAHLAMFVPAFYRRAQREEQALEATFGAEYRAYRQRTGRFLPGLRR